MVFLSSDAVVGAVVYLTDSEARRVENENRRYNAGIRQFGSLARYDFARSSWRTRICAVRGAPCKGQNCRFSLGSAAVLHIGSIVLRVDDVRRQTEFWQAALGYVRRDDGASDDFVLLGPPDGAGPHLSLDQVRSTLQIPPRLHLDLYTDDQAREVARLIALGATEIHWDKRPPDADYVILADPEGNRFCVVDTAP
jgi:catechol 2,3-dioxygenase-like lactoylglutathione lyase family enzyme